MAELQAEQVQPIWRRGRLSTRILVLAAAVWLGVFVAVVGPHWLKVIIPRWLVRDFVTTSAYSLILVQVVLAVVAPLACGFSIARIRSLRRKRQPWEKWARVSFLSVSGVFTLAAGEAVTSVWLTRLARLPSLPTNYPQTGPRTDRDPISIAVIGESSAEGEPYHPWLSVGQIVAWQLPSVFPDRPINVEMLAAGGICLEQAITRLYRLKNRPDAILIYAGHNEFQARYGWDRNGGFYDGERNTKSLLQKAVIWLSRRSNITGFAREVIDYQQIDQIPLPSGTRQLVDRPSFSVDDYELLRGEFHRRLEHVVSYCDQIGAIPILVIPPSNDADYPPNRSYCSASTSPQEREQFARDFDEVARLEQTDPTRAIESYRQLLRRQPRFAETHYRLAKLLESNGQAEEATLHYELARDCDGMPMRCLSDFREAYRRVAAAHPSAILIDGPSVLRRFSPRKQLDFSLFHDGQHPNLRSYTALSNHLLERLAERGVFGWPKQVPAPQVTPRQVSERAGMNSAKWEKVADRCEVFYSRTAYLRFESQVAVETSKRYAAAREGVSKGGDPQLLGLGSLDDLVEVTGK